MKYLLVDIICTVQCSYLYCSLVSLDCLNWVFSERNVWRKNAKMFVHIYFAKINEAKNAKTKRIFVRENFRGIWDLYSQKMMNFRKNFAFFAKQIEAKFRKNSEKIRIFRERTKCEIFAKRFSFFAGNPNCPPSVLVLYCNPGSLVLYCPPGIPVQYSVQYCHLCNKCTVLFCTVPLVYLYCSNCTVLRPCIPVLLKLYCTAP